MKSKTLMLKRILIIMCVLFCNTISVSAAPVTINAKELDLHDTIMMIANMGGLSVSIDDSVKGTITISLENVEPADALNIIAKTKNLRLTEEHGIFILTANLDNAVLMNSYILPVKYGDIEELRKAVVVSLDSRIEDIKGNAEISQTLRATANSTDASTTIKIFEAISKMFDYMERDPNNKRVMINKDSNVIIMYGTAAEYERACKMLQILDVPLKQVMIEAKVLAINKSAAKDLGVEWSWSTVPQYPDYNPTTSTSSNNVSTITEGYYNRNHGNSGYGIIQFGRNPEGLRYEMYYGAKINAMITNGKAKILSRPNITTIQGREAIINVGGEVPIPTQSTTNSTTTTSFTYRDAGIILRCTPTINEDGSIRVIVNIEVSTPQYVAAMGAYSFNKRAATTTVTLQDGEPMVIGGLIGKEEENSISKIPFLGDLPILGALFRNRHKSKSESELVIFLTAQVINNK